MARVTVEDCVLKVPNRFELVLLAAQRARDISSGGPIMVERDNDKNPVVALREIADTDLHLETLRNAVVKGLQKTGDVDQPEEETAEITEIFAAEQEIAPRDEDGAAEGMTLLDQDGEEDAVDEGDAFEPVIDDVPLDEDL